VIPDGQGWAASSNKVTSARSQRSRNLRAQLRDRPHVEELPASRSMLDTVRPYSTTPTMPEPQACLCGHTEFDRVKVDRPSGPNVTAFISCRRCGVMFHAPIRPGGVGQRAGSADCSETSVRIGPPSRAPRGGIGGPAARRLRCLRAVTPRLDQRLRQIWPPANQSHAPDWRSTRRASCSPSGATGSRVRGP
jgi:hypothetical protein